MIEIRVHPLTAQLWQEAAESLLLDAPKWGDLRLITFHKAPPRWRQQIIYEDYIESGYTYRGRFFRNQRKNKKLTLKGYELEERKIINENRVRADAERIGMGITEYVKRYLTWCACRDTGRIITEGDITRRFHRDIEGATNGR